MTSSLFFTPARLTVKKNKKVKTCYQRVTHLHDTTCCPLRIYCIKYSFVPCLTFPGYLWDSNTTWRPQRRKMQVCGELQYSCDCDTTGAFFLKTKVGLPTEKPRSKLKKVCVKDEWVSSHIFDHMQTFIFLIMCVVYLIWLQRVIYFSYFCISIHLLIQQCTYKPN